jgi:hypothetical protein
MQIGSLGWFAARHTLFFGLPALSSFMDGFRIPRRIFPRRVNWTVCDSPMICVV